MQLAREKCKRQLLLPTIESSIGVLVATTFASEVAGVYKERTSGWESVNMLETRGKVAETFVEGTNADADAPACLATGRSIEEGGNIFAE